MYEIINNDVVEFIFLLVLVLDYIERYLFLLFD